MKTTKKLGILLVLFTVFAIAGCKQEDTSSLEANNASVPSETVTPFAKLGGNTCDDGNAEECRKLGYM